MKFLSLSISILLFSFSFSLMAQDSILPITKAIPKGYFEIDKTLVNELSITSTTNYVLASEADFDPEIVGEIIKIGKSIWDIVKEGAPVANTEFNVIHFLPFVDGREIPLRDLYGWSRVERAAYEVTCTNKFNMETVKYRFAVTYRHHGQFNDRGFYLSGVDIIPLSVHVKWGYTFNAKGKVKEFLNRGSKDFPMAHVSLDHTYTIDTILVHNSATQIFDITANGEIQKITL